MIEVLVKNIIALAIVLVSFLLPAKIVNADQGNLLKIQDQLLQEVLTGVLVQLLQLMYYGIVVLLGK